jgi:hypothetical protein
MGQEADVVLNYMNRNPDKRDLAAAALVPTSTGGTERPIQSAMIGV